VKPVAINPWGAKYNLAILKAKSAKRVKASRVFELINSNIKLLQQQKKQTLQALQLQKIVTQQETLKNRTEKLNKIQTAKSYFKVWEPGKASQNQDWLKQINKDVYIEEASMVLNDLAH
jgi:hypothetical protein